MPRCVAADDQHLDLGGQDVPRREDHVGLGDEIEDLLRRWDEPAIADHRDRRLAAQADARRRKAVVSALLPLEMTLSGDRREPDDPAAHRERELDRSRIEAADAAVEGDASERRDRQAVRESVLRGRSAPSPSSGGGTSSPPRRTPRRRSGESPPTLRGDEGTVTAPSGSGGRSRRTAPASRHRRSRAKPRPPRSTPAGVRDARNQPQLLGLLRFGQRVAVRRRSESTLRRQREPLHRNRSGPPRRSAVARPRRPRAPGSSSRSGRAPPSRSRGRAGAARIRRSDRRRTRA